MFVRRDRREHHGVPPNLGSVRSNACEADRHGARFALIIGEEEFAEAMVTVKSLEADTGQLRVPTSDLVAWLEKELA